MCCVYINKFFDQTKSQPKIALINILNIAHILHREKVKIF